jgi:hypothetical protein
MSDYTNLFNVVVLGIATGAISMVVTKATIFNKAHEWLGKHSPFLEEMLSCPWCTSHHVALFFTLIYQPLILNWTDRPAWMASSPLNYLLTPVDFLVTIMVMVAIASVSAHIIHSAYKEQ